MTVYQGAVIAERHAEHGRHRLTPWEVFTDARGRKKATANCRKCGAGASVEYTESGFLGRYGGTQAMTCASVLKKKARAVALREARKIAAAGRTQPRQARGWRQAGS